MNTLFTLTSIFFFIWIFRNILFWIHLWQVKEYRLDRMHAHLQETVQGKSLFFSSLSVLKWIGIIAYGLTVFHDDFLFLYQLFVAIVYGIQAIAVVKEIYSRTLKRPRINFKAFVIFIFSFLSLSLLFFFPIVERFLWFLILDKTIFLFVTFCIWIFSFPTEIYRDWKVERAAKRLRQYKEVIVIGITGSYGKSSTKEYTAQILGKKFNVLKTQGSNNTPIGIANTILKNLRRETQIFVVEMGAYKKGEIAQLCAIVRPQVGILTAVSNQHLSLFGSLEKTMQTKYELIESLPRYGLALFNENNINAYSLYEKTLNEEMERMPRKAALYKSNYNSLTIHAQDIHEDIYAYNIKLKKSYISFDVLIKMPQQKTMRRIQNIQAPVIGVHNTENILPGIYIASYLGMSPKEIKDAIASFIPLSKTMILYSSEKGTAYLDDTFNANPQSIILALEYMKLYKTQNGDGGRRILVLQPMIELGRSAGDEHYKIGKQSSVVCDYLLLTNKNYYKSILKGIQDGGGKCEVRMGNPNALAKLIQRKTGKNDVVVFEGKEAGNTLKKLAPKLKVKK